LNLVQKFGLIAGSRLAAARPLDQNKSMITTINIKLEKFLKTGTRLALLLGKGHAQDHS
jgi:hypothetical protein